MIRDVKGQLTEKLEKERFSNFKVFLQNVHIIHIFSLNK